MIFRRFLCLLGHRWALVLRPLSVSASVWEERCQRCGKVANHQKGIPS